jgi:hypothetical protein
LDGNGSNAGLSFSISQLGVLTVTVPTATPTPTPTTTPAPTATATPTPMPGKLVISQVYGGGGNNGAPYNADFVEIFNTGSAAASVSGFTIQYAAATGNTWQSVILPNVTLAPGQYLLVRMSAVGTTGNALPTVDVVASPAIAMSASNGKVALSSMTTTLSGVCPTGSTILDFVGYGTANCSESSTAPAPSNTMADLRVGAGCTDTNDNFADFALGPPNPRNSSSPFNDCP